MFCITGRKLLQDHWASLRKSGTWRCWDLNVSYKKKNTTHKNCIIIIQDNSNMALLSEKKFSKECVRVCVKVIMIMMMIMLVIKLMMMTLEEKNSLAFSQKILQNRRDFFFGTKFFPIQVSRLFSTPIFTNTSSDTGTGNSRYQYVTLWPLPT